VSAAPAVGRDFLAVSRRLLDVLGADGLGSESDQRHFAVDGLEPPWVALPATAEEAERVLRICAEHDLAVVPAGSGLRLGQGLPPERLDVVLSTARMSAVIEHAAADLTLTVEAGAPLAAVGSALRSAGQWLPFDPAFPAQTTIGGLIAARACGPSRQAFGTARESLIGVRALLADGTSVKSGGRVVKNVAGYDLQKLLVGSFGTLAVIVEATFKLQPLAEVSRAVCFSAPSIEALATTGAHLADSVLAPQFVELLARAEEPPVLIAGFSGAREDVEDAVGRARGIGARLGAGEAAAPIDEEEMRVRLEALQKLGDDVAVMRAGVRRDALVPWLQSSLERCQSVAERVHAQAHAGIGVARLRLEGARRRELAPLLLELRDGARRVGGYLVVESAPPAWKESLDVWGPPGPDFALMKGVKAAFDPQRRLSPGRLVGRL
jgi:glycolate dehydrogenase FAD-binding subunit